MSGKKINSKFLILFIIILIGWGLWYFAQMPSEYRFSNPIKQILKEEPKLPTTLLIVGDIMLDRNVRNKINEIGFDAFFAGVKDMISSADIAVANLEGPFTTYPSKTASLKSKELTFTFDPALAPKLAEIGFDIMGLANNHTLNFGREGFTMTKKYLSDAGMAYYGDPNNKDGLSVILEKHGIVFGFIGFHEFTYMNFDKVIEEIKRIRPAVDMLIVSPHWGNEYEVNPTETNRKRAYQFIDAGADAVIGAHAHVIGEVEEYKGKKIFYSLGNFAFDQYFSKETSEGLAVKIDVEKEGDIITTLYTLTRVEIGRTGVTVLE